MHFRTNFLKHKDKDKVHTVITMYVTFKPGRFRADKNNGVINESPGRTLTRETTYSCYSQQGQRRTPCMVYEQRLSSFLAQRQNETNDTILHIPYRISLLFGHKVEIKELATG